MFSCRYGCIKVVSNGFLAVVSNSFLAVHCLLMRVLYWQSYSSIHFKCSIEAKLHFCHLVTV